MEIARSALNSGRGEADRRVCDSPGSAASARRQAMEIDRISLMGGVGHDASPSWTREKMRRHKFVEEVEPLESDAEQEEAAEAVELDEGHDGALDVIA
jgi:hypothetical protein